ncbi:MAG TPA: elongation factor Ts [Candidatus Paceibacterota bacterium]|nr:elongation factor Ts [Candidatus Paceibacterota bacterium]
MAISAEVVKELRDKTGVSVMECKKALEEAGGDLDKALEILKTRAADIVGKKATRELGAGTVASYIHSTGQVGAMIMLSCETDFVSKNEEFVALARDIAMHAAAMRPENSEALLAQPFIKDQGKTIADLISGATQKFGERIEVVGLSILAVK